MDQPYKLYIADLVENSWEQAPQAFRVTLIPTSKGVQHDRRICHVSLHRQF